MGFFTSQNYYHILGVEPSASPEEIKRAYLALVRQYHPDVNKSPEAREYFLLVQEAFAVLGDPQKRLEYDKSLSKQAQQAALVKVRTTLSRNVALEIDEPQLLYALVDIEPASQSKTAPRPPLNVCLLLDRSTSMKGERMEALKHAASLLVQELRSDDIFSLVAFDDRADVIIPATRGEDKEYIRARINLLQPQGGTEIYRGLLEAYRQVGRFYSPGHINAIIMLTDGHTYGDEHKCERLARQAAKQGIVIHGLGLGAKWNDAFVDKITSITGGSSVYVRSARDIGRFLEEQFHAAGRLFAQKVALDFSLGEGVTLHYAFRLEPEPMPLRIESPIALGGVPRGGRLRLIFEFLLPPMPKGKDYVRVIAGTIRAHVPSIASEVQIPWSVGVAVREKAESTPPPEIADALARLTMYRMQEKAKKELAAGEIDAATRHLENLATRLLQTGNAKLADVVKQEAQRLKSQRSLSPKGEKEIKFGTRALLLPAKIGGDT